MVGLIIVTHGFGTGSRVRLFMKKLEYDETTSSATNEHGSYNQNKNKKN